MQPFRWSDINPSVKVAAVTAAALVLAIAAKPILWPGGWGFQQERSVTEIIKIDAQGNSSETIETITVSGKTLWDWLGILGVPLSLAVLGWWLQQFQQHQLEEKAKEEDLQVYIDRISTLVIEKNLLAIADNEHRSMEQQELLDTAVVVIRARTLSVLRRFKRDSNRKTSVIQFLVETDILSKLNLSLQEADLSRISFCETNLSKVNLKLSDLREAFLQGAHLEGANLSSAKLQGANLNGAHLDGADLNLANLQGAKAILANLEGANLRRANLCSVNLGFANLKGADLTEAQMDLASLDKVQFDDNTVWPQDPQTYMAKTLLLSRELSEKLGLTYKPPTPIQMLLPNASENTVQILQPIDRGD